MTNNSINSLGVLGPTLFAGAFNGIFRSEDKGNTWTQVNTGLTVTNVSSFAVLDPTLFAGTNNGVFRSEDKGDTWGQINKGLTATSPSSFAIIDNTIFAGTSVGVFRSGNRGNTWTWTPVNPGLGITNISFLAVIDTTLFAASWNGIFRSEDRGETWKKLESLPNLQQILFPSLAVLGNTLFASSSTSPGPGLPLGPPTETLFRSEDKGETWKKLEAFPKLHRLTSFAVLGNTLFVAGRNFPEPGILGPLKGGLFRSEDKGNSWKEVEINMQNIGIKPNPFGFPQNPPVVQSLVALSGNILFASTFEVGLIRSNNKGKTWEQVNIKLGAGHIKAFATSGKTIFAGAQVTFFFGPDAQGGREEGGGVFLSEDKGDTWAGVGLKNKNIEALAVLGNTLFAATRGEGVFRAALGPEETPFAVDEKQKLLSYWGKIKTALLQNYPNPFNPETWIPYQLSESAEVTIQIYDVTGKLIRTLSLGRQLPGLYISKSKAAHWDGKNHTGESVATGIYYYRMEAGKFVAIRKMIITK